MVSSERAFSGFSVNDITQAKRFYGETLGLKVAEEEGVFLHIGIQRGGEVLVYSNPDHVPATFTILNFEVENIEDAVDELVERGVQFERYEGEGYNMDERGIARNDGPYIAWFKDPAGNILSLLQEKE